MSYRVEVVCDEQIARPGDVEGGCHSTVSRSAGDIPVSDAADARQAKNAAVREAKGRGWKHVFGRGRPSRWICPACVAKRG